MKTVTVTYQDGFTDDADQDAPCEHGQVLQQEAWGHDQTSGADEQRHEEVADAGQLAGAVLLLICGGQHHSGHKGSQLRRQALQAAHGHRPGRSDPARIVSMH